MKTANAIVHQTIVHQTIVHQNETVAVMDMVRGAPSHAAFSVIADRYGVSSRLFATIENSVDRNTPRNASTWKLTYASTVQ